MPAPAPTGPKLTETQRRVLIAALCASERGYRMAYDAVALAGGSGKTTTALERVGYLNKEPFLFGSHTWGLTERGLEVAKAVRAALANTPLSGSTP